MFRILRCITLMALLVATLGCSQNYYNVPRESFEKKVRVIGVAPIIVDADSDIRHPDKEALISIVKETNRKNDPELAARLKESGGFFAVRPLSDDPDKLFADLLFRRERREDAGDAAGEHGLLARPLARSRSRRSTSLLHRMLRLWERI